MAGPTMNFRSMHVHFDAHAMLNIDKQIAARSAAVKSVDQRKWHVANARGIDESQCQCVGWNRQLLYNFRAVAAPNVCVGSIWI